jgi:hypothetical protein
VLIEALVRCAEALRRTTSARQDVKSKLPEALKEGSPKRAAPNINSTYESCGKLKASNFSCGKAGFFRGGSVTASSSVKNAVAMILRKIFRQFAVAR